MSGALAQDWAVAVVSHWVITRTQEENVGFEIRTKDGAISIWPQLTAPSMRWLAKQSVPLLSCLQENGRVKGDDGPSKSRNPPGTLVFYLLRSCLSV